MVLFLSLFNILICSAQDLNYAREIVKTLASPEFKGRGYVENGDKKASAYIAAAFKKAGLIPLNSGEYFQNFALSVNTFPGKVSVQLDHITLNPGIDYLVNASSPSINGQFKVITATRSQLCTEQTLTALITAAKESFISLDNRPDNNETAEQRRIIADNIDRLNTDAALDFKGLIIFSEEKLTWTTLPFQSIRPVLDLNKKDLDPQKIKSITLKIEAKFIDNYETCNVAGMVKGTKTPDSLLVVTAHFDHLGLMGKDVYFPGANDNASGTAMLLCLVKYYSIHKPGYSIVFLAFSGEEIGLLGSMAFIKEPLIDLKKIKFLINFDLAGTGEEGIKVVNGSIYRQQFDKLVNLNQQYKLLPKVDIRGAACNSDHCLFYERGVPSFFIYTQGGIKAYHDVYDRAETLPLTAFENYFKLMVRFFDTL